MATNKDIIEKLECVETKLMNGELEQIHQTVTEIKEVLLDPEDGIIVRVNKNTFWRKQINRRKFRYIYFLCDKREKKRLIKTLKHPVSDSYPKDLGEVSDIIEKFA